MKRYLPYIITLVLLMVIMLMPETAVAQCPMCKASVESSMKEGSRVAIGLNKGILYLLLMPYFLYGTIFLVWWRKTRRRVVVG
ncbi:hypothetical protein BH09BAC1_BH09BAC1_13130 [soil metagenome]